LKNTKKALLMTSLMTSAIVLTACGTAEEKPSNAQNQGITFGEYNPSAPENTKKTEPVESDTQIMKSEKEIVTDSKQTHSTTTPPSVGKEKVTTTSTPTEKKEVQEASLFEVKEERNYQPDFHSGWKTAPTSSHEATIDGKGEEAIEEGYSELVVKNTSTNTSKIYSVINGEKLQVTPKYVDWIDNNRLYVIVGFPYGTVTKGGELYELNLTNDKVTAVITNLKDNEEIVSVKQNKDGTFTYQKHIYDDENFNEGHFEIGTLPDSPTK
jgi:hypothetical protein